MVMFNLKYFWMGILSLCLSFSLYAHDPETKKIRMSQVAKSFTLETDPAVLKVLKTKPWEAKKKQIESISVRLNDSIIFYNADDFVHNVFSSFFDLKTQMPGKTSEVVFNKEGTFDVQCAIHPKMKIKVTVTK